MYAYTHASHATPQGQTNPTGYYAPAPGYAPAPVPAPATLAPVPAPSPTFVTGASRTPSPFAPVSVPPGCHAIELVQFWRGEYKRGQPYPLQWALFLRTAPHIGRRAGARTAATTATAGTAGPPRGNFYELVGTQDTYTAQFLQNVTFEPDMVGDWRGTHVIGWVSPEQVRVFERAVRQVPVWRHRPDWRSQQWVYEVAQAVGGNYQGMYMSDVTFWGLQKHMGRLLDAWERGDI